MSGKKVIALILFVLCPLGIAIEGLITGDLLVVFGAKYSEGATFSRSDNPSGFWTFIALYLAVAAFFLRGVLTKTEKE
jgi:hypothetical protein